MCKATLNLVSPDGFPVSITIAPGDDGREIMETVERIESIGKHFTLKGWQAPEAQATGPSAAELAQGPTFAGYPCSPSVNADGLPSWIIVDGQQARRREKQGDTWYSVRVGDQYMTVLSFPRGEIAPAVVGLEAK